MEQTKRAQLLKDRMAAADRLREELRRELALIEARHAARDRKKDTRRKVLMGAFFLNQVARGRVTREEQMRIVEEEAVRAGDRELFGLPPLAEAPAQGAPQAPSASEPPPSDVWLVEPVFDPPPRPLSSLGPPPVPASRLVEGDTHDSIESLLEAVSV
jgi:large subunit ribosomal protein L7/L12